MGHLEILIGDFDLGPLLLGVELKGVAFAKLLKPLELGQLGRLFTTEIHLGDRQLLDTWG